MKFNLNLVALALLMACGDSPEDEFEAQVLVNDHLSSPEDAFTNRKKVPLSECSNGRGELVKVQDDALSLGSVARVLGTDGGALVVDTTDAGVQWWEPGIDTPTQVWDEPAPYTAIVGSDRRETAL